MERIGLKVTGLLAVALLSAAPAAAQGRERAGARIPKGYEPPAGMCRVWLAGVPASQQPAPTDCATAIRKRPENASVIFGPPARDARDDRGRGDEQPANPIVRDLRRPQPQTQRGRQDSTRAPEPTTRPTPNTTPTRRVEPPPRSDPRRRPPDDMNQDLAVEQSLDRDLLAALYGEPSAPRVTARANGRVPEPSPAGGRGRVASGMDVGGAAGDPLGWAWSATGDRLTALEVERMLRLQLAYDGAAMGDDGRLDPRPGECFDRDFDGRCDDLSAGADGCFDRNNDGRCDDVRWDGGGSVADPRTPGRGRVGLDPYGADPYGTAGGRTGVAGNYGLCFDRDRDGRCDEPWSADRRIPQTLPEMASAVGLQRGVASYDVERWLRRTDLSARITDRNGDGIPERVTWLDQAGRIVQSWTDRDGDGIADRVELFRDGLPVQVIGR